MKKNIVIVILLILVLGLAGYLGYDKFLSAKTVENASDNTNSEIAGTTEADNTENDYQIFAKNLKSHLSRYDENNLNRQFVNNDNVRYPYTVYLNENGSLFVKYSNSELNAKYGDYKISDDVLSFYVIETGNGGMSLLYFINGDGTIGSADVEFVSDSNQITVKKDLGYKNIVSIVSGSFGDGYSGAQGPIFIDINGNIFSENLK